MAHYTTPGIKSKDLTPSSLTPSSEEGDDTLIGGPGLDAIIAGSGDDTIFINPSDVPEGAVEDLVCGSGADTVILKGFPAGTSTSFPITDLVTGGTYENSAGDCEMVIRG
jgi:Ca2+-binding RTX toxin-like protein